MLCINRHSTNPYINLAAEEYVLKNFDDDCFMLYINEPCIIIGKHQNALAEINLAYVRKNCIPVIRRLSGGGTVFHDMGNLNYTFIKNEQTKPTIDFKKFTEPIIYVLNTLGIDARHGAKNDLTLNGKKISGNAQHIWKHKVLHHGTLLFSSDIKELAEAIKVTTDIYNDKAVKSNRSEVTNIADYLQKLLTITQFQDLIIKQVASSFADVAFYEFTDDDIAKINKLVADKYATWDWNYGYSPKYNLTKTILMQSGKSIAICLNVKDGIIIDAVIAGDYLKENIALRLSQALINVPHNLEKVSDVIQNNLINEEEADRITNDLLESLF